MSIQPISGSEFLRLVDDPDVPDSELAKYFIEDEIEGERLAPGLMLNPALVIEEPGLESAAALNLANGIARHRRHKAYARKIKKNPGAMRIVAEGDSWFQYPFILDDIIDHVSERPDLAVLCYSAGGDILSNMAAQGEFYAPIEREEASVFLISGGGNDVVDDEGARRGIRDFLLPFSPGREPKDYFNANYRPFMDELRKHYDTIFRRVLALPTSPKIICHAYSDAVPQPGKGKWLGKPMSQNGITDPATQFGIIQIVLDDLASILKTLVVKFAPKVKFVDLRGIVPANGWHNEFHPNSHYFGEVTKPILAEILK